MDKWPRGQNVGNYCHTIEYRKKNEQQQQKNEDSLRDLWDNIKHINIHIIRISQVEERARTQEHIWRDNRWKLP